MESETISHATASIVCSPSGMAGSFTLDLGVKAKTRLIEDKKGIYISGYRNDNSIKKVSRDVLEFLGYRYGLEVEIDSKIPSNIGLGDKEAVSSAVVMGIAGALAIDKGSINILKIDKYLREQFLEIEGKVVDKLGLVKICAGHGMRFDKLCASMFGGFFLCDNPNQKILRRGEMENLHALIYLLEENKQDTRTVENELEIVWTEALKGNLYTAMRLKSYLFSDRELIDKIINSGALSVTTSNGSLIALFRNKKYIEKNIERMQEFIKSKQIIKIIKTEITNKKTEVLRNPRRIIRTAEFLKMKGDCEYYFL